MKKLLLITTMIPVFLVSSSMAQTEEIVTLETETGNLEGTLLVPGTGQKIPAALIIAGSGPTDRNGNNPNMTNNSLKLLARGLAGHNIATLRYDKRGIGKSKAAGLLESELRFDHYIEDAVKWLEYLAGDDRFGEIAVIGHSQGALIGMIIARHEEVERFVSIAGSGVPANELLRRQLKSQPPVVMQQSLPILEKLEKGDTAAGVPQMLYPLFRPSVQPYMISWFRYDPREEIARLDKPVLIVQGETDIQLSREDAETLAKANPGAELQIIEGMNHIMKESASDRQQNIQTYNQPDLPLKEGFVQILADFIK